MYEELYTQEVERTINTLIGNVMKNTGIDRDELMEIAHDTFMLCADKYNPQRKIKFHTFYSKSLGWKLYNYCRRGSLNGGKRKNGKFYGRIDELKEMEEYNSIPYPENISIHDGIVFCGREVKGWHKSEDDLLLNITMQHMSRDAKLMLDEITFNYDKIMEKKDSAMYLKNGNTKQRATFYYFMKKGWDNNRIMSAFREIKENLQVA